MAQVQKTREQKVREDRARVEAEGFWIYNDIPRAFEQAKSTGKPMLVVLRCLPCEECVKLDDEVMDQDPIVRPLLEKFVCVRQVATNGLDLTLFQFDTDQSFAVFMLNADKTIYGRFGTRSHRTDWLGDVSLPGLAQALEGALELHANYPANQSALADKQGGPWEVDRPELFPNLKEKYTDRLNYDGNVVQSCIHCHQIGDARREFYRQANKPIPDKILFPTPHPKSIGLVLDPDQKATVKSVTPDSIAARAGFQAGDTIDTLNGQPLLSIADVQWVLDQVAPEGGTVAVSGAREQAPLKLTVTLPDGWRRSGDISWRVSTWGLRRMALGGLVLEELPRDERKQQKIAPDAMALRVKRVGQYGPHATAKKAGFEEGDIITAFDGHDNLMTESEVLIYGVTKRNVDDQVPVTILRDGMSKELIMPMQL
ncbi:MAG: PDZ domain-containing protein [Planctomycetales bacterium]|nr:PDZ domain-containing protein [Planctomycetales bacterium]